MCIYIYTLVLHKENSRAQHAQEMRVAEEGATGEGLLKGQMSASLLARPVPITTVAGAGSGRW